MNYTHQSFEFLSRQNARPFYDLWRASLPGGVWRPCGSTRSQAATNDAACLRRARLGRRSIRPRSHCVIAAIRPASCSKDRRDSRRALAAVACSRSEPGPLAVGLHVEAAGGRHRRRPAREARHTSGTASLRRETSRRLRGANSGAQRRPHRAGRSRLAGLAGDRYPATPERPARTAPGAEQTRSCRAISLAKLLVKRDDAGVEGRNNENEFYREILRRAKTARERAAESLKRSRASRKRQADLGAQADASQRRRRFRRQV
jgi:hypothetical protein